MADGVVAESQPNDAPQEQTREHILRHGHKGIITMNTGAKMESITTLKSAFAPPRSAGVRLQGIRSELLERRIAQIIRDKIHAERNPPLPQTEFATTTQRDFRVEGFVPQTTKINRFHDYTTEQAISYWSENYQRIQGVSAVECPNTPFRKSAQFSTPIGEQREDIDPFI
ncbi:sperm associated antigen 8 [Hippocampus zosterae]|uniref:sperm associated antigen 8 n=1 Tax=Hippocampus zosterae TaxID=109293 RepID=UPI00223DEF87|nr:sperm associated antigen 8 [Hippocampus zosterae]